MKPSDVTDEMTYAFRADLSNHGCIDFEDYKHILAAAYNAIHHDDCEKITAEWLDANCIGKNSDVWEMYRINSYRIRIFGVDGSYQAIIAIAGNAVPIPNVNTVGKLRLIASLFQ